MSGGGTPTCRRTTEATGISGGGWCPEFGGSSTLRGTICVVVLFLHVRSPRNVCHTSSSHSRTALYSPPPAPQLRQQRVLDLVLLSSSRTPNPHSSERAGHLLILEVDCTLGLLTRLLRFIMLLERKPIKTLHIVGVKRRLFRTLTSSSSQEGWPRKAVG